MNTSMSNLDEIHSHTVMFQAKNFSWTSEKNSMYQANRHHKTSSQPVSQAEYAVCRIRNCSTASLNANTKSAIYSSITIQQKHLQNLVHQSTKIMIQPTNFLTAKILEKQNSRLDKGFSMSSPVLGKFSGLPLGILGEYNTRRNKNSTLNVKHILKISRHDLFEDQPRFTKLKELN